MASDDVPMTTFGMKMVKQERFNPDTMLLVLKHDGIDEITKRKLKQYFKKRTNGNVVEVNYDFPKKYKDEGLARLYADKGLSLQSFPCDIRNALGRDYYFDVDMKNAHPTILLKLCEDNNWSCPNLKHYVDNRDDVLLEISEKLDLSKSDAKTTMNSLLYLGGVPFDAKNEDYTFISDYSKEMFSIAKNCRNANPDIFKKVSKKQENERKNLSTNLSFILTTEENKILMCMNNYLEKNGRNVDVFIYDGCWVRRLPNEKDLDERVLIDTENHIKKTTGYNIKLAVKPLVSSLTFTKSKAELLKENEKKRLEEKYKTESYQTVKENFETRFFKVMNPMCYCEESEDGEIISRSKATMGDVFENKYCMVKMSKQPDNDDDDDFYYAEDVPFLKMWMEDVTIRTYTKMDMYPPPLECPSNVYNLFNGFAIQRSYAPSSGNVQPFLDHYRLLVNNNENSFQHHIKWHAHTFQQPAKLQGTAPILRGEQGTGKSILCEVAIKNMIGEDKFFSTCNPTQDLFSRFGKGRYRRIFININETSGKESCANSEIMKEAITATSYNHEDKGVAPFTVKNFNRFYFTTNNNNPVKIEQGDRRYFIEDTSSERIGDKKYFDELMQYYENDCNLKAIYEYLMSVDVSNVNWIEDRPKNEAYSTIQAMYVEPTSKCLINICKIYKQEVLDVTGREFYKIYQNWSSLNMSSDFNIMKELSFGISMTRLSKDALSGITKKKSDVVHYILNIPQMQKYFMKRNIYDNDYMFKSPKFLGKWIGYAPEKDLYD